MKEISPAVCGMLKFPLMLFVLLRLALSQKSSSAVPLLIDGYFSGMENSTSLMHFNAYTSFAAHPHSQGGVAPCIPTKMHNWRK